MLRGGGWVHCIWNYLHKSQTCSHTYNCTKSAKWSECLFCSRNLLANYTCVTMHSETVSCHQLMSTRVYILLYHIVTILTLFGNYFNLSWNNGMFVFLSLWLVTIFDKTDKASALSWKRFILVAKKIYFSMYLQVHCLMYLAHSLFASSTLCGVLCGHAV